MNKRIVVGSVVLGKYQVQRKLAKSTFGDMFLSKRDGEYVVLKVIDKKKKESYQDELISKLQKRVEALKSINFNYVVELKEFNEDENYYYIVLEYCDGGDLMSLQARQPEKVFPLETAVEYLSQVILGVLSFHQSGFLHRNISPQSILIKNTKHQLIFKIAGLRNIMQSENSKWEVLLGTPSFMAPQIFKQELQQSSQLINDEYGYSVDVWAFGVLFYYMLNHAYPFQINPIWSADTKYKQLTKQAKAFSYKQSVRNHYKKQPVQKHNQSLQNCTPQVQNLFRKIFMIDRQERINFSEIRLHPVFIRCFPKSDHQPQAFYKHKNKYAFLGKGKRNKSAMKAPQKINQRLVIPSSIDIEYSKQESIMNLLLQEICFLPGIVEQIGQVERQVGQLQYLMFAFNLTKYHIVLLFNLLASLTSQVFRKKFPGRPDYFSTSYFNQFKHKVANRIMQAKTSYEHLYKRCVGQFRQICKLNDSFGNAFDQCVVESQFDGEFFRSYRKSTNIMYAKLKKYLMTNKVLKFYYLLCMTCICHVFSDLYESEQLKKGIFSSFLEEITVINEQISYQQLSHYLKNSPKQVLLVLAKNIIENLMMNTQ